MECGENELLRTQLDGLQKEKTELEVELIQTRRELENTKKALIDLSYLKAKIKATEQPFWRRLFRG